MNKLTIIEPSSKLDKNTFKNGIKKLKEMKINYKVPVEKDNYFFTAGIPNERFKELKNALIDKEIEFIMPERGGAGAIHLLPHLKKLKLNNKKILIGSSDFTFLGLYFLEKYKFPFCYGPMLSDIARNNFSKMEEKYVKKILKKENFIYKNLRGLKYLNKGKAKGKLIGGNLTLFVSMLSFFKFSPFKNKILYLEDVNEPLYKIDRNLSILKIKGILNQIEGVIFGKMKNCFTEFSNKEFIKLLNEYFKNKNYPLVLFFPSGHSEPNLPLWIGGEISIDSNKNIIESRFSYDY